MCFNFLKCSLGLVSVVFWGEKGLDGYGCTVAACSYIVLATFTFTTRYMMYSNKSFTACGVLVGTGPFQRVPQSTARQGLQVVGVHRTENKVSTSLVPRPLLTRC